MLKRAVIPSFLAFATVAWVIVDWLSNAQAPEVVLVSLWVAQLMEVMWTSPR